VVIAAGQGKRLAARGDSKPLVQVGGRPLIEWVIRSARQAGLTDIAVVTGCHAGKLKRFLRELSRRDGLAIETIHNSEWEKENGISVRKAKGLVRDKFVLLMADHLFAGDILPRLVSQPCEEDGLVLAVDFRIKDQPHIDLADVTRVQVEAGRIKAIGKHLGTYNAFDTGMFLCTPLLFSALEQSGQRGDHSLSGGVQVLADQGKAGAMDVGGSLWIDVDDEKALENAEELLPRLA
jgi:choline kinase